ncbi:prefoldin subunit 1 [Aplysia californica]|uniref:Prefoldin subunit 1 n=1 Tax=Aplysia californica TaxID=6500 RepID=A0ABM0JT11_APLCA|nr:prefoldin subunit 1 [Aplysia californica]
MAATRQVIDPELSNAFAELSLKKAQSENQIRISNSQIENLTRKIQHSHLVEQEVKNLPSDVRLYKAVGRMFLLRSQDELKGELKEKQGSFAEKIKSLESSKEYLQRNIEECKNNVRELVMSKQSSR